MIHQSNTDSHFESLWILCMFCLLRKPNSQCLSIYEYIWIGFVYCSSLNTGRLLNNHQLKEQIFISENDVLFRCYISFMKKYNSFIYLFFSVNHLLFQNTACSNILSFIKSILLREKTRPHGNTVVSARGTVITLNKVLTSGITLCPETNLKYHRKHTKESCEEKRVSL